MEISLEPEMSTDIVTATPSIDFSVHWSKVVRERIRYNADEFFFENTDASHLK